MSNEVAGTWFQAYHLAMSKISKGFNHKRVPKEQKLLRVLSCHGNETTPPCERRGYNKEEKFHYCDLCGCGKSNNIARLDSFGSEENKPIFKEDEYDKLDHPYLKCPLNKPGFS